MDIWTVEDGELVLYKRAGACSQCGECCCAHAIKYQMQVNLANNIESGEQEGSEEDWSSYEGWAMFLAQGVWWYFKIDEIENTPSRCSGLSDDNKCTIWQDPEDFRPICRYWPFDPSSIQRFSNCSFRFEKVTVP